MTRAAPARPAGTHEPDPSQTSSSFLWRWLAPCAASLVGAAIGLIFYPLGWLNYVAGGGCFVVTCAAFIRCVNTYCHRGPGASSERAMMVFIAGVSAVSVMAAMGAEMDAGAWAAFVVIGPGVRWIVESSIRQAADR